MNRLIVLVLFLFTNLSFCQIDEEIINKTIKENQDLSKFDSISNLLGYKGGDEVRVSTMFIVTKSGEIDSVVAKGPHSIFENEAIRIIKKLPQLDPLIVDGKPITQRFALPITFVLETEKQKKKRVKQKLKTAKKNEN